MTAPFRRRVLYLPGFDPIPPRRYRELYRREGAEQARLSGYELALQPSPPEHGRGFAWQVRTRIAAQPAEARIEVLVWSDIVQAQMQRGIAGTYLQLARTVWTYAATGTLWRLARLRRGPLIAALYPVAVLLCQLLLAGLAAAAVGYGAAGLGLWLALPAGLAAGWAVLALGRRLDHRLFAYYLLHDYAFTAAHGGAYPPALEARLAEFRATLQAALAEEPDEVLVVGHSSGAYLAVSLVADLIRAGRRKGGPDLSLMTIGQVVPMASFLPKARRLRADLALVARAPDLFWLDVSAPGDACCFALCDPVAVSGVGGPDQRWPLVVSAAYRQSLSPEKQRQMRHRWFRRHFQYLCAFDRPGDYDYFAVTAGPKTLAQRFAGRKPSPGRITRPALARP